MSKIIIILVIFVIASAVFTALDGIALRGSTCVPQRLVIYEQDAEDPTGSKHHHKQDNDVSLPKINRMWCPKAACHSNFMCSTCQRRFLIILTLGRTASTTLTWTLNYLPGVRMGGEEQGLLALLMSFEEQELKFPFMPVVPSSRRYGAFDHNPMPDGALACGAQRMVEAINPPCFKNCTATSKFVRPEEEGEEIIGFKTIKFVDLKVTPKKAADFLTSHFPCARFIINYSSNVTRQAESQIRAFRQNSASVENKVNFLEQQAAYLFDVANEIGAQAMLLDSAQWTNNITVLNEAVEWLGFTDCAFPRPLALNTGGTSESGNPYSHSVKKLRMHPECRYTGSNLL